MRAETVAEIVGDILADFKELDVLQRFETLTQKLRNQIDSPTADNQIAVRDAKNELLEAFAKSRFSTYPVSLGLTLEEMSLTEFLPDQLAQDVTDAFSGNEITPAGVLEKVEEAQEKADRLFKRSSELDDAAAFFEFASDGPEDDDDFEFSFSIPRDAVNNELDDFGRELVKIDKLLGVFSEIATGSRSDFKIKSISSSDLTVVLESVPAVALIIVTALERLTSVYERMLNIITLHRQLKESKVPEQMVREMEKFTQKTLKDEISEAAKEIEGNLLKKIEGGRRQELRTELRKVLEELISRFDRGYVFDVRGPDPETASTEEGSEETSQSESSKTRRVVAEKRELLRYFKAEAEPVLGLRPPENPSE